MQRAFTVSASLFTYDAIVAGYLAAMFSIFFWNMEYFSIAWMIFWWSKSALRPAKTVSAALHTMSEFFAMLAAASGCVSAMAGTPLAVSNNKVHAIFGIKIMFISFLV